MAKLLCTLDLLIPLCFCRCYCCCLFTGFASFITVNVCCCTAESVQFWLQSRSIRQTSLPTTPLSDVSDSSPKSARLGGMPLQRTDSCRWGSFRQRKCTVRRTASLGIVDSSNRVGIVDSSNRDILMTQPLPEESSSNPHGVLDSAGSLFDTLTFHFHGA